MQFEMKLYPVNEIHGIRGRDSSYALSNWGRFLSADGIKIVPPDKYRF